jgi:hypothetical protein
LDSYYINHIMVFFIKAPSPPSKEPLKSRQQADWRAFLSVFSHENPFDESIRGLSLLFPEERTKPAIVISGTYNRGDWFDKRKEWLSSDLILEMTWRGSQQEDDIHVVPQKPLMFDALTVAKKVYFLVLLVAFGLSLHSYTKLDSFEIAATFDEAAAHRGPVLEHVPLVGPTVVVPTRVDTLVITKTDATKNITTPLVDGRVSTPSVLDRINHLLQDELSAFAPSRSSEGAENLPLGREVHFVTNSMTQQLQHILKKLQNWRSKRVHISSKTKDHASPMNAVCDQSWQWLLHRQCRVKRIGDDKHHWTPSFQGPAAQHIWTRNGRGRLRNVLVTSPTTTDKATVAEIEIPPVSSARTRSKKRKKPRTFRETVMVSLQSHTTNFQRTQQDILARHQAGYL